jgi:dephospho-CoA kinase
MRVGLTGGIGSGKSTVLEMLRQMGAASIDADAISRATTAVGGAAIAGIVHHFGPGFITPEGALDRERMRARVYADPSARYALEAIIHPLVGAESTRQVEQAQAQGTRCIVFDIPLLVESGRWRTEVDRVLVVDCLPATQIARVVARNALDAAQVQAIMAAQAPRELRLQAADAVIFNEGLSLQQLQAQVRWVGRTFGL